MEPKYGRIFGFEHFKNWHCEFPIDALKMGSPIKDIQISEPRIEQLVKRIDLKGMRILELGCLEGLHSFIYQNLGAQEVIAIEGRIENFLKCLIVKNAFGLDKCKFLFGDLNKILSSLSRPFDLCSAIGILYHLYDPVSVIHRISELANSLFVWTHYATKDYPKGVSSEIRYQKYSYRGKYVGENARHYLSGLHDKSFWLFEEDLFRTVRDAGFKNIDLIQKEDHEHGPAINFLAKK